MQLKIELMTGQAAGEVRLVGGNGGSFIIGTTAGATWLLPLTQDAPGDIRIEQTRDGLAAVLHKGTAYLDQRALTADVARPLVSGSVLTVAGHQLRAVNDAYDPQTPGSTAIQPTISSILSQAASVSPSPDNPRQNARGDDWISTLTEKPAARPEWGRLGQYEREPDADVAEGPLGPAPQGARKFLPPDWDLSAQPSDTTNRMAQSKLADAALRIGRNVPEDLPPPAAAAPDKAVTAFLKGAGLVKDELKGPLPEQMEAFGQMLRTTLGAIARLEDMQSHAEAELGLANPLPHAAARQADATLLSVSRSPELAQQSLDTRLADLEAGILALWSGTDAFATSARDTLDPDLIEAAAAAAGGVTARLNKSAAAWATYRTRYAAGPLATETLATAIREASPAADRVQDTHKIEEDLPRED